MPYPHSRAVLSHVESRVTLARAAAFIESIPAVKNRLADSLSKPPLNR
jgi:hypothetical protein